MVAQAMGVVNVYELLFYLPDIFLRSSHCQNDKV